MPYEVIRKGSYKITSLKNGYYATMKKHNTGPEWVCNIHTPDGKFFQYFGTIRMDYQCLIARLEWFLNNCTENQVPLPEMEPLTPHAFYVSVIDGTKKGLLLGPYKTHAEALEKVDIGRALAYNADSRAVFYSFGTCKITSDFLPSAAFGVK